MADTVAMVMEGMLPELDDLESKGYFSRSELKEVIKKRQDFEYAFKRRATLKRDFLKCIEFETKLEELRRHRRKTLKIKGKRGPAETGIIRRIHFTYERATRKFKADLELWLGWIDFCKQSHSTKQISKVLTKALQRHGHVAALWIEAAIWEFEHNANVSAARALMQQGLRHCRTDEGLWGEYLRMELLYVVKMRTRRVVLGLPNPENAEDIARLRQQEEQEEKDAGRKRKRKGPQGSRTDASEGAAAEGEGGEMGAVDAGLETSDTAQRAVLAGAILHVVIKGAITAAPHSLSLRQTLLRVVGAFGFPGIQGLKDVIMEGVAADFGDREEAWDMRARSHLQSTSAAKSQSLQEDVGHQRCCEVFRSALAALPTPLMHTLYADYLEDCLGPALQIVQASASGQPHSTDSSKAQHSIAGQQGTGASGETEQEEKAAQGGRSTRSTRAASKQKQSKGGTASVEEGSAAAAQESALEAVALLGAELLALYQAAHATGQAGPEVYVRWADSAMLLAQPKVALRAIHKGCERWAGSAQVWSHQLKLELELRGRRQHAADDLFATLEAALASVPAPEAAALWEQALRALGHHQKSSQPSKQVSQKHQQQQPSQDLQRLQGLLTRTLAGSARGPVHGGMGAVAASFLQHLTSQHGISAARALWGKLLTLPAAGGDFFRAAIALEQQELEGADGNSAARKEGERCVQRLFEAAVDAYGSEDADMWLAYTRFEASRGKGAGQLYWRATKALADPESFIHRFREVQQGV